MAEATKKPAAKPNKSAKKHPAIRIHKHMRVSDILTLLPDAGPIVAEYGLHCFSCEANAYETLDEGCKTHGFRDTEIDDLVTDLNELLSNRASRPQVLTVTNDAADALLSVLQSEGKPDWGLSVGLDEGGGFCMEFAKDAAKEDKTFEKNGLRIFASTITLGSIGGATIDFREGRFKLDLPEDSKKTCACGKGEECGCKGEKCICSDKKQ